MWTAPESLTISSGEDFSQEETVEPKDDGFRCGSEEGKEEGQKSQMSSPEGLGGKMAELC